VASVTINVGGRESYTADLKKRLKKHHISQNQLAKEMGVAPTVLSRWFNSPIKPNMTSMERIEIAFIALVRKQERKRKAARNNGA